MSEVAGLDPKHVHDTVNRHRSEPTYRPIMVVDDASLAQVAAVLARQLDTELPDVQVDEVPTRQYPAESFAAHLFGYVGEASEGQVESEGLNSGAIVGQAGVEKIYNKLLMGEDGARLVKVNSMGREIGLVKEIPATSGRRVQLTIDKDLQRAAEEGFKAGGFNGAAVVMDPRTGEVLAFTSRPGYDPNDFAAGIDRATWDGLNTDPLKPLQNRAIQGLYSPGSTFKIVVAVAALEEGVITPDFRVSCRGSAVFYGRPFQCWKKGGHGSVDLRHAMEQSCNVYYYTIGNMVGVDKIHKWATLLGLGEKTGIDLPNEIEGLVPSTEWKRRRYNEKWYAGETISVSIGQGQVSITPISLAVMMSTVANGGTRFIPHLLKAVDEGNGLEARAASRAEVARAAEAGNDCRAARRLVPRRQWRRHRWAGAHSRQGRLGKDRNCAGDFAAGRQEGGGTHRTRSARSRLVRIFRSARQSGNRRRDLRRAQRARLDIGAHREIRDGDLLQQEGRQAAAEALDADARCRIRNPTSRRRLSRGAESQPRSGAPRPAGTDMLERRLYLHLDWLLLGAIMCLTFIGVAMIYSTTGGWRLPTTQMYAIVIGAIAFAICLTVDYRALTDKSHFIYLALLALLIYVLFFGTSAGGARRWISLGAFNLQPSEFAKVGVALVLAKFFGENRRGAPTTGDLFIAGLLAGVPLILIAREPDLGTAVTLLPIYLGIAYVAGMRLRIIGILAVVAVVTVPIAWNFALKPYQKSRVETFLDPSQDPRGAGYQQIQAQITVGSGGLHGQGLQKGHAGAAQVPARRPQRLHLFGACRRTGFCRRAVRARPVPDCDLARARGGASRQGSAGRLSGDGAALQLHVSGDLQHHDVGRPRAGQGFDASAVELRRVVDDRHAGELRPDPQRADAPVY